MNRFFRMDVMDRLIALFFLLLAHHASADLFSQAAQSEITQQLSMLEAQSAGEVDNMYASHFIQGLQSKHVQLVQYFADDSVSETDKVALLDMYAALNQALNQLGVSDIQTSIMIEDLSRGNGSGVIRGFVRDDLNESPIQNAAVRLYNSSGFFIASKNTDSIGRYIFTGLEDGQYLVSAAASYNYVTEFYPNILCAGGLGYGCQPADLTPIELVDGQQLEQINFNLVKQGKITGYLLDSVDNDSINGQIKLHNASGVLIASTYAAYSTGAFTIFVPDAGTYYLVFDSNSHFKEVYDDVLCNNGVCDFNAATPVVIGVSDVINLGNIMLDRYSQISGQITDMQTGQVPDYLDAVELLDASSGQYMAQTYPDSNGNWSSGPLPAGGYHVRTRAGGYVAQYYLNENCASSSYSSCNSQNANVVNHSGSNDLAGIDFNLQVGSAIKGKVFDVHSVGTQARVSLYNESGDYLRYDYSTYEGDFEFSGLSSGTYYLSAVNDQHLTTLHPSILCSDAGNYDERCFTATQGNAITLSNSSTVNKNVRMKVGASVSGKVRTENNLPINNAQVYLFGDQRNYSAYTDASGDYTVSNVKAGSYRLSADASEYAWVYWPNYVCTSANNCDEEQGSLITVSGSNSYNNRNLQLPELGQVDFTVNNPANQPVTNGSIYVYDSSLQYVRSFGLNSTGQTTMALYPDSYYFVFKTSYGSQLNRVYGGNNCYQECQPNTGTAVAINFNQSKILSMTVDDAFVISGTINEEVSTGNNWKYIRIYQNNELVLSRKVHSSSQFEEVIRFPGSIKVEAYQQGHYSKYYQGVECYGEACGLSQATAINVVPNQSKNIDFDLNVLSHLKGRIINTDGQPLAGIQVTAYRQNNYNNLYDTTDENGNYELYGLTPGDYNLRATTDGVYESTLYGNLPCPSQCQFDENNVIAIDAGDFLNNRNITMSKRGSIKINAAEFVNGGAAADVSIRFVSQSTGNSYYYDTDDFGDLEQVYLPADNYRILARYGNYSNSLYTAYPDIICPQNNNEICLDLSPDFMLTSQISHVIDDFKINQWGKVLAEVIDESTAEPISGIQVQIINTELEVVSQSSTQNGVIEVASYANGSYYIYASTDQNDAHQSELYNEIDCGRGIGFDCLLSQGSLLEIAANSQQNVLFTLKKKPTLMVNLSNAYTGNSINGNVAVFSITGEQLISSNGTDVMSIPVNAGQYFITGQADGYNTKAYPSALCDSYWDLNSCNLSAADLITVEDQNIGINLGLDLIEGINGQVTNAYTEEPIEGVVIDFWRNSNYISSSAITNQAGRFSQKLSTYYDYLISTDVSSGLNLYNEVYNNQRCFEGPAVIDMCDPLIGEWLDLDTNATQPTIIEFKLDGDAIYQGGFELD